MISARRRRHSGSGDAHKQGSPADGGQDPGVKRATPTTTLTPSQRYGDKRGAPSSSPAGGDISPVPVRSSSTLPTPQPGSAPATPTSTSGKTSSSPAAADGEEEQRGDLILFYNSVYIKQMRHFALRYTAAVRPRRSPARARLEEVTSH